MKKYRKYIQVFAICAEKSYSYTYTKHYLKRFERMLKLWDLEKITDKEMLKRARYGAILSLEGANCLQNMASIDYFYNCGVRLITLVWNNSNKIASSIAEKEDGGLTDFGKRLVKRCEELGILVDLSHISDNSFFDVCDTAKKPFVCSHSNSRAVNGESKRNVTDEEFSEIIKRRGCVGINFFPKFIGKDASMHDIISHIEHFCSLGGEDCVGLGTDFDGISSMPKGCTGEGFIYDLSNELLRLNYKEEFVNNFLYDNFKRVFTEIL